MLNTPNSENKKSSEPFAVHNLTRDQLKQIARETRDMKPLYKYGTCVCLKKDIKKNDYIIPKNSFCWVEQILIRLDGEKLLPPGQNKYKIYYALLYEFPDDSLFPELGEVDLEEDVQPAPADGYIIFAVEESDISE